MSGVRYVDEFRDGALARAVAERIRREARDDRTYSLMEFCGGHTHAIFRYGVEELLPESIRLVHGPGCPVCVLPMARVDLAIRLARDEGVTLCSYGDLLRVPGHRRETLLRARAEGADVRMVYSVMDALAVARREPDRQVVFFAIGFETTTPPTAVALQAARAEGLRNFSVVCNHVLTPPALDALLTGEDAQAGRLRLDGFLGPSHVSAVIGSGAYEFCPERHGKPVVIAGFEPLDVLQSVLMLVRLLNDGRSVVENQYTRVVTREGNRKAQARMAEVFEVRESFAWRGLGELPLSALRIRGEYADLDAEKRFPIGERDVHEHRGCRCPEILRGIERPTDCRLFGTVCTPDNPMGSCMVSSEGACAAYYQYGRGRETVPA